MPALIRFLLAGACTVVILAGIKAVAPTLTTFLIALLLAQALSPIMLRLIRWKVPSGLAIAGTLLFLIGGGALVITMVGISVAELSKRLPIYGQQMLVLRDQAFGYLNGWGIDTTRLMTVGQFDPAEVVGPAAKVAAVILADLGHSFLVLLFAALLLIEFAILFKKLESVAPNDRSILVRIGEMSADLQKYLGITALVALIGSAGYAVLLGSLGVPFIATWVVLYFLLSFIPAIGGVIAIVPVMLVTLMEHGFKRMIILLIVFVIGNFILGDLLKPRIMQKGFEISIITVFFSLVFWNWLLGPIGMVLAVPITITLRKLFQEFETEIRQAVWE